MLAWTSLLPRIAERLGLTVHPQLFISFYVITYMSICHLQIHQNDWKLKREFLFHFFNDITQGTLHRVRSLLVLLRVFLSKRTLEKWHYPHTKEHGSFLEPLLCCVVKYCWTASPCSWERPGGRVCFSALLSSLHCSLGQYWDMSGSLPGTCTGTDTPGEIKPAAPTK